MMQMVRLSVPFGSLVELDRLGAEPRRSPDAHLVHD